MLVSIPFLLVTLKMMKITRSSMDEKTIKELLGRINSVVKVRTKEPTVKVSIGKESDKDEGEDW